MVGFEIGTRRGHVVTIGKGSSKTNSSRLHDLVYPTRCDCGREKSKSHYSFANGKICSNSCPYSKHANHIDLSDNWLASVLEGNLLGDGSISKTNQFRLAQGNDKRCGHDHRPWVRDLNKELQRHNVHSSTFIDPGKMGHQILGKLCDTNDALVLQFCAWELRDLRYKWYPRGRKVVPPDVELTPTSLAHWYMGDGNLYTTSRSSKITLCTNGFDKRSCTLLVSILRCKYGLDFNLYRTKSGWIMCLGQRDSVETFLGLIVDEVHHCFNYKTELAAKATFRLQRNNPSGFRGVHVARRRGWWRAWHKEIGYLGEFEEKEVAALVVDEAERQVYGRLGLFNFPRRREQGFQSNS